MTYLKEILTKPYCEVTIIDSFVIIILTILTIGLGALILNLCTKK